jgi:hypothetical protein
MPRLVRLFLVNGAIGFGLGALFTALLLWLNVANLGHLVAASPQGWLAAGMLAFFSGITFGGVQIGIVVMAMAEREDTGRPPRRRPAPPVAALAPLPVTLPAPPRPDPAGRRG